MTWAAELVVLTGLLVVLLASGQWIAFALATTGLVGLLLHSGLRPLQALGSLSWNTTNNFVLTSIPLFILMGEVVLRSGLSDRFYKAVAVWLGRLPGGLLHSNIIACAIFSAVSGSSAATAAAIGTVAIPEMTRRGYRREMVFGSLAAGGALGNLIPPGIVQIIYGAMVEESVGRLFIACLIPGALAALLFMAYIAVRVALQPELVPADGQRPTARDLLLSLADVAPMVGLMALVLGGIYLGWTTPTEAAALGAAGAFVVAGLYRRLTWSSVREAFAETVRTSCMVLFIILGAQMLSYAFVNAGINRGVTEWVASLGLSKGALFVAVVILYVILGCLVDGTSMILLTLPVLYPVVQQAGFDPIWFGTLLTILVELGQITPPVGLNLFVIHGISGGRPIGEVIRGALPYTLLFLALVVLMWYFPSLALWLPNQIEVK